MFTVGIYHSQRTFIVCEQNPPLKYCVVLEKPISVYLRLTQSKPSVTMCHLRVVVAHGQGMVFALLVDGSSSAKTAGH